MNHGGRRPRLEPYIAGGGSFSPVVACVWGSPRFDQEQLGLNHGKRLVLYSFWNDEHLSGLQVDRAISEVDSQMPVEDDEGLICIGVMVPNEISLQPSNFELVVVHLRDHSRRPLLGETVKFVRKINRSVKGHAGLHRQTHRVPKDYLMRKGTRDRARHRTHT